MSRYLFDKFDLLQNSNLRDQSLLSVLRCAFEMEILRKKRPSELLSYFLGLEVSPLLRLWDQQFTITSNPDLQNELRIDNKLIIPFIEEVIRMSPPFKFHYRYVKSDCFLGGYKISSGDKVLLSWDRLIEMKN